mmetsp:Transcript_5525/g.13751  ORF Transcript_5525/g.13751 Transcript_5525/m.13751 type:complete len:270 (-) Transcript_5525:1-810(-)
MSRRPGARSERSPTGEVRKGAREGRLHLGRQVIWPAQVYDRERPVRRTFFVTPAQKRDERRAPLARGKSRRSLLEHRQRLVAARTAARAEELVKRGGIDCKLVRAQLCPDRGGRRRVCVEAHQDHLGGGRLPRGVARALLGRLARPTTRACAVRAWRLSRSRASVAVVGAREVVAVLELFEEELARFDHTREALAGVEVQRVKVRVIAQRLLVVGRLDRARIVRGRSCQPEQRARLAPSDRGEGVAVREQRPSEQPPAEPPSRTDHSRC